MKIYGDINSGNCLKVKYTQEILSLLPISLCWRTLGLQAREVLIWKTGNKSGHGYKTVNGFYHYSLLFVTKMLNSHEIGAGV